MIKKEILNKTLTRPNWTKQEHRVSNKLWLNMMDDKFVAFEGFSE